VEEKTGQPSKASTNCADNEILCHQMITRNDDDDDDEKKQEKCWPTNGMIGIFMATAAEAANAQNSFMLAPKGKDVGDKLASER